MTDLASARLARPTAGGSLRIIPWPGPPGGSGASPDHAGGHLRMTAQRRSALISEAHETAGFGARRSRAPITHASVVCFPRTRRVPWDSTVANTGISEGVCVSGPLRYAVCATKWDIGTPGESFSAIH